jgi:3,4-dihydroxy-2-butanone 4-phosphate synthase
MLLSAASTATARDLQVISKRGKGLVCTAATVTSEVVALAFGIFFGETEPLYFFADYDNIQNSNDLRSFSFETVK